MTNYKNGEYIRCTNDACMRRNSHACSMHTTSCTTCRAGPGPEQAGRLPRAYEFENSLIGLLSALFQTYLIWGYGCLCFRNVMV